jgi:hypothetical protein
LQRNEPHSQPSAPPRTASRPREEPSPSTPLHTLAGRRLLAPRAQAFVWRPKTPPLPQATMKSARRPSEAGQETPSKRKHNDETLFDGAPPLHLLLPSAPRTHPRPSFARLPHCATRELEADLQTTRSRPPLHQPASRRGGTPRQEREHQPRRPRRNLQSHFFSQSYETNLSTSLTCITL